MTSRSGIAVAVDGSATSLAAVQWAATEAAHRRVKLTIVHVCEVNSAYLWSMPELPERLRELSRPLVSQAMELARRTAPEVEVGEWTLVGPAARMLLLVSEQAGLMVLGRSGKTALAANLVGSATYRMAAHAHCPVITIPAPTTEQDGSPQASRVEASRVVVGLADRPTEGRALDFAIREAARHRAELVVVRAWHSAHDADPVFREGDELRKVSQLVSAHLDRCSATVSATPVVRAGAPASVLSGLCRPGDLLVLGQHRHAPFVPANVGKVIAECLHRVSCPVAVVPEPVVAEAQQEQPRVAETVGLITY